MEGIFKGIFATKHRCHDTQLNNIQHSDTQYNDTQHKDTQLKDIQHNDTGADNDTGC